MSSTFEKKEDPLFGEHNKEILLQEFSYIFEAKEWACNIHVSHETASELPRINFPERPALVEISTWHSNCVSNDIDQSFGGIYELHQSGSS